MKLRRSRVRVLARNRRLRGRSLRGRSLRGRCFGGLGGRGLGLLLEDAVEEGRAALVCVLRERGEG